MKFSSPRGNGRACEPFRILLSSIAMLAVSQTARGDDKFWNGTGNNVAGVWTSSNTWWSTDAAGTVTASSGAYGGDAAIFSASSATTAQISQLGADLSVARLIFTGAASTTLLGGNGDHSLQLYGGIVVNSGAGAVVIGSTTAGQKVNLLQQGDFTWTNDSANGLTLQNDVHVQYTGHSVTGSGNITVNGVLSGGGGSYANLNKTGSGTLTLNGANTYVMKTVVSGGALVVNGNQSTATSELTVSGSGTRLAGTGTIGGNTTIGSGSIHSSGALNSVGKQTFDKAFEATTTLTYGSGSIFSWDIDRTQIQTRGVGYDAVDLTGTLSGTGAIFRMVIGDSQFNDVFWSVEKTWDKIFTSDGTTAANWTGIFTGFQFYNTSGSEISTGAQGSFSFVGNNTLKWTPQSGAVFVPEPSSAIAGLLLGAGLLRRRRKN